MKIETVDKNLQDSATLNDDLIVETSDAVIGLYSGADGGYGSAIQFVEIGLDGGLVDKWGIVRNTGLLASRLLFTFGPGNNYGTNPTMVAFDTLGRITSNGLFSTDTVLIETTDLTPSMSAMVNDELIIEAGDVVVGLYSSSGGVFGSGISMDRLTDPSLRSAVPLKFASFVESSDPALI